MASAAAQIGQKIGKYRLVRQLGEGGLGSVFEGIRDDIGGRAAVKLLHPEYARSPEAVTRFTNEARAANLVDHPSVVRIFDHGVLPDGRAYLAMELLEGEVLSTRIARLRRFEIPDALRIVRQLAAGLSAAHAKKVVHRDLKPANVIIIPDPETPGGERAKLLDFGIAKLGEPGQQSKTRTGVVMGTPLYMSPEQCRGAGQVFEPSDVYSLGVMLFEMLTGTQPFQAEGDGELIAQHMFQPAPPLSQFLPGAPPELTALLAAMLQKDPAMRPTMPAVAAELLRMGRLSNVDMPALNLSGSSLPPQAKASPSFPSNPSNPSTPSGLSGQPAPSGPKRQSGILGMLDEPTTALPPSALPPSLLNQNFEVVPRTTPSFALPKHALAIGAGAAAVLVLLLLLLFSDGNPLAKALLDAREATAQRQWEAAAQKLHTVLAAANASRREKEQARELLAQVESEQRARTLHERFTAAASNGNHDAAIAAWREIPATSIYRELGRADYARVLPQYTEFHLRSAEDAQAQGHCEEVSREVALILANDPRHTEALALRARPCPDETRQVPGKKKGKGDKLSRKDEKESGKEAKEAKEGKEGKEGGLSMPKTHGVPGLTPAQVDEKLAKAQSDFVDGHYRRAIALAMSVQTGNPVRAWRIIGSAACNLRDAQLASDAYKHTKAAERPALVVTCRRNGLALQGNMFKLVQL
jgi:serine/threonine protein kinase